MCTSLRWWPFQPTFALSFAPARNHERGTQVMANVRTAGSLAGALVLTLTASAAAQPQPAPASSWASDPPALSSLVTFAQTESDLRVAVLRYKEDEAAIGRRYPVLFSPARAARLRTFYEGWRAQVAGLDFDRLNPEGRV